MLREIDKETGVELRTLIVTAIGASVAVWDIAFWLGVQGHIFYSKLFSLWVSATVVLLVALLVPKHDRFLSRWGIFALTTPTIWFVINSMISVVSPTWIDELAWFVALLVFVFTIPYILYILFQLVETDALQLSSAYRNRLIGIVLVIAIMGYLVGSNHVYFVSCEQFSLSGDNVPADCADWELD